MMKRNEEVKLVSDFRRRKAYFGNETKDINDVFHWDGEDGKQYTIQKLKETQLQESPGKWNTE